MRLHKKITELPSVDAFMRTLAELADFIGYAIPPYNSSLILYKMLEQIHLPEILPVVISLLTKMRKLNTKCTSVVDDRGVFHTYNSAHMIELILVALRLCYTPDATVDAAIQDLPSEIEWVARKNMSNNKKVDISRSIQASQVYSSKKLAPLVNIFRDMCRGFPVASHVSRQQKDIEESGAKIYHNPLYDYALHLFCTQEMLQPLHIDNNTTALLETIYNNCGMKSAARALTGKKEIENITKRRYTRRNRTQKQSQEHVHNTRDNDMDNNSDGDSTTDEVEYPGVGSPGVGSPGVGSPGVGSPGVGSPGVGSPDFLGDHY